MAFNKVPMTPPTLTAPAVRKHRHALESRLVTLRACVPAVALASSRNEPGAGAALRKLQRQISGLEFEIEANNGAHELAQAQDRAAHAAWRVAVHTLSPDEVLSGLGKDSCASRCLRNVPGGCVLSGGCLSAECMHPIKSLDSFHNNDLGRKVFPLRGHERASALFAEAASRLKVVHKFEERR